MATFVSTKGNLINDKGAVVGKAPAGTTGTFSEGVAPRSAAGSAQSTARATSSSNPHDAPGYNPANDPLSSVNMKGAAPTKPLETPINTATGLPSNLPPTTPSGATIQPASTQATPEQVAQVQNASNTIQSLSEEIGSRYKTGLANVKNQGIQPAATLGQANGTIQSNLPSSQNEPNSVWPNVFGMAPELQNGFIDFDKWMSPPVQKETLLQQYTSMTKALGLDDINAEMINIKNVIDGNEDMIRAEITAAGGVATDGQIMAMTNARNKQNIINYNKLVDLKTSTMQQLETMMDLSIKDRELAEAEFDRKMNFIFKVAEFKERATNNARQTYMTLGDKLGWDTLLTQSSPYEQGVIAKTLGMSSQALNQLATASRAQRAQMNTENALDLDIKRQQLYNLQLTGRKAEKELGIDAPTTALSLAKAQGDIKQIDMLAKGGAGLSSAVGTTAFGRAPTGVGGFLGRFGAGAAAGGLAGAGVGALFGGIGAIPGAIGGALLGGLGLAGKDLPATVSGQRQEFISGIEQLRSNLNLDTLIQAKAEGATFGALSDQELKVLSSAATKLGTYAITDSSGNVLGYNANEKGFKKELDRINYYAKLDYILKGGSPSDIGVVENADGTLWMQNSDGSLTQLQ